MSRKDEIKALIARTVGYVLGEQKACIFIFGSQANASLSGADIDVGIDAGAPIEFDKIRRISYLLNQSPECLYPFDVVDFAAADEGFKQVALRNIERIV